MNEEQEKAGFDESKHRRGRTADSPERVAENLSRTAVAQTKPGN